MGRAKLTRRQQRQYRDIIGGDGTQWVWPHAHIWPGAPTGNGWCALIFARQFGGRDDVDMKRLQLQVIRSGDPECAYQFARDVPGANVRRLQKVVLEGGRADVMRAFAKNVPGSNARLIEAFILIAEVMRT